jgi:hypothetical protein
MTPSTSLKSRLVVGRGLPTRYLVQTVPGRLAYYYLVGLGGLFCFGKIEGFLLLLARYDDDDDSHIACRSKENLSS